MIYESTSIELDLDLQYTFDEHVTIFAELSESFLNEGGLGDALRDVWKKIVEMFTRFWNWLTGKKKEQSEKAKSASEEADKALSDVDKRIAEITKPIDDHDKSIKDLVDGSKKDAAEAKARMEKSREAVKKLATAPIVVKDAVDFRAVLKVHNTLAQAVHSNGLGGSDSVLDAHIQELHDRVSKIANVERHNGIPDMDIPDAQAAIPETNKALEAMKRSFDDISRSMQSNMRYVEGHKGREAQLRSIMSIISGVHNDLFGRVARLNARLGAACIHRDNAVKSKAVTIRPDMTPEDLEKIFADKDTILVI